MNTEEAKNIVKRSIAFAIGDSSQASLAKKAGITQGAIGKYLRGEALPKGETANALSRAIDGQLKPVDFAPHIFIGEELTLPIDNTNLERRVIDLRTEERRVGDRRSQFENN